MRTLMALVWIFSGLFGVFQGAQSKRFLPSYIHRGLSVDRRGYLNLDNSNLRRCTIEDIIRVVSVEDLRRLVEGLAKRQGSRPVAILKNILALELTSTSAEANAPKHKDLEVSLQTLAMRDLYGSVLSLPPNLPPPPRVPGLMFPGAEDIPFPPTNAVPANAGPPSSSSSTGTNELRVHSAHHGHEKINNRLPPLIMAPFPPGDIISPDTIVSSFRKEDTDDMVEENLPHPSLNYPIPRGFRPPAGAIVSVDTGGLLEAIPEVPVTVAPMMTVVEALRQADFRFQRLLNLPEDSEVFEFAQSPFKRGCFVIASIGNTPPVGGANHLWTISITDRNDQVVYRSLCLPTSRQMTVKPGMKISLIYGFE